MLMSCATASPVMRVAVLYPLVLSLILVIPGWIANLLGMKPGRLSMPLYFYLANLAVLIAYFRVPFQARGAAWDRSSR